MTEKSKFWFSIAKRLFLNKNKLSPFLQISAECLQFLLYLPIIFNLPLTNQLLSTFSHMELNLSLFFIVLVLIRIISGISLIKFVYVIILNFLIQSLETEADTGYPLLLLLLIVLVGIDVISNISFDFYSENQSASNLNFIKIIDPLVFCFGVTHSTLWPNTIVFQSISISAFLVLFLLKRASMMKNGNVKQLMLRFYLWMMLCHLSIIISIFASIPILVELLVPLAMSQLIYKIYAKRKGEIKLDELLSQDKYIKLAFEVCRYIHGKIYNGRMQAEMDNLLGDRFTKSLQRRQRYNLIYEKLTILLAKDDSFQSVLISAQIFLFWKHQLLKSKEIIESIKLKLGCFSWMKRILVYRVEQTLLSLYQEKNKQIHFLHYECYYQCDQFRNLLLKTSVAYINLWQYTRKTELLPQKLRQLTNKLVSLQQSVNKSFDQIQVKCVTISLLYVSYVFEVAKDITKGNKILQMLSFNQDFQLNFQLDEKVFLRLSLEQTHLKVDRIGQNVSTLLGYNRKEVQGMKSQIFLPQFYRKAHKQHAELLLVQRFQALYLFSKKSIVKNKWGYYEEANLIIRLHYDIGQELRLQGYIQTKKNNKYAWNDYIFVAENEDIIECSDNLSELMPTLTKVHKIGQYFEQPISLCKPQIHKSQDTTIQYTPLVTFTVQNQKIIYFVNTIQCPSESSQGQFAHQRIMKMLNTMNLVHFDWQFVKEYYLKVKASLESIFSLEYVLMLVFGFILIIGIFACESEFLVSMNSKKANKQYVVNTCNDVLTFYNISLKLGMDLNYIDLNQQYGYTNNFTSSNLIQESLALQTVNQKLKRFVNTTFILPSLIPGIIYNKYLYDIIEQLLANAYMIEQFNDDPFVVNSSMTRIRMSIQTIYLNALNDYRNTLLNSISTIEDKNKAIDIIALVILIVLLILFYLIVVRVQYKMRVNQNQIFQAIGCIRDQQQLIESAKQFISKITKEQINYQRIEIEDIRRNRRNEVIMPAETIASAQQQASVSEMSIRQMSGRNLMDESLNRSSFIQTTHTNRNEAQAPPLVHHSFEMRLSNRNKIFLILPLILIVPIVSLSIGNQIKNNLISDLDEVGSINNIFALFRISSFYSRATNGLLNLINLRATNNKVNTTLFDNSLTFINITQTVLNFQQSTFPQFAAFQKSFTQVQYQYMCTYIDCDPRFSNQINIIYSTTIIKMATIMQSLEATINKDTSQFLSSMNRDSTHYNIDLLFYTEKVIRSHFAKVFLIYLQCFNDYSADIVINKSIFIGCIIVITGFGVILFMLMANYVYKNQCYLSKIGQIIKTDSYINDENHALDKENMKGPAVNG